MIFLSNAAGEITAAIPETINQGSIGVNKIVLIAPFPASSVVSATFTLPNGIKIYPRYVGETPQDNYPYLMGVVEAFGDKGLVIDGVTVNAWQLTLDKAITQIAGKVTVQFLVTTAAGTTAVTDENGEEKTIGVIIPGTEQTLTTTSATLPVNRGNAYISPNVDPSQFELIEQYLAAAKLAEENAKAAEANAKAAAEETKLNADRYSPWDVVATQEIVISVLEGMAARGLKSYLFLNVDFTALNLNNFINGDGIPQINIADSIEKVEFRGCTFADEQDNPLAIKFHYQGSQCSISGAKGAELIIEGFADVIDCRANIIKASQYVAACDANTINNCMCVTDSTASEFIDCKFVDPFTVNGFVPEEDNGKVPTLDNNGLYIPKYLPQKISLSYDHGNELNVSIETEGGTSISEAQTKLPIAYVTPEMFGAVGDGIANDREAFSDMFSGPVKTVIFSPGKTYYLQGTNIPISGYNIDMNGSTLHADIILNISNRTTIENGTILLKYTLGIGGYGSVLLNLDINGTSTSAEVTGYKNSDMIRISNCRFGGEPPVPIILYGSNATIENCVFDPCSYLSGVGCIRISAANTSDAVSPSARNTKISNCYFGLRDDPCINCVYADGVEVERCVFDNGVEVGIKISNQYSGYVGGSVPGIRISRNIHVRNCEFNGTGPMSEISTTIDSYTGDIEPVSNISFVNCSMPNFDSNTPISIGSQYVESVTIDNLALTGITANRTMVLYGNNITVKNIDNPSIGIWIMGSALVEKCKINAVTLGNANVVAEIAQCSDYNAVYSGSFVTVNGCQRAVIHDCNITAHASLVILYGSPQMLIVRNNVSDGIINNGASAAGGQTYVLNNIYKLWVIPSASNTTGIAADSGNVKAV